MALRYLVHGYLKVESHGPEIITWILEG
jgi:hypothetical protein